MSICAVSTDPNLFQLVREGLGAASTTLALEIFPSGSEAIARLYNPNAIKPKILLVDVSTTPDAAHLIDFVRASGWTRTLPVIAIIDDAAGPGATLADMVRATHVLKKPVAAREITRVIDALGLANFADTSVTTTRPASPSATL